MDVRVLEDPAPPCAEMLAEAAAAGGDIALTGGSTPKRAYERAAELEGNWSRTRLWWGDDRCVPPDDELSNYRLAKEALLDHLPPEGAPEVHRIPGEQIAFQVGHRSGKHSEVPIPRYQLEILWW